MEYKQIKCNSLIKKITTKDKVFRGTYCIDPYQNCEFGCLYCDSSNDKTINIKINASQQIEKELKQLEKGVIIIGSVHDPYQKAEEKYEITKKLIETIQKHQFPIHILTKSTLVLRDIKLLSSIQSIVTISIISINEDVSTIFEKNTPKPIERLHTVKTLAEQGIKTGIAIIPIIPYIVEPELENIIKTANKYNAQYIIHKHLELKGDQKLSFTEILQKNYPNLLSKYNDLYQNDIKPSKKYISQIKNIIHHYCKKYNTSEKITL